MKPTGRRMLLVAAALAAAAFWLHGTGGHLFALQEKAPSQVSGMVDASSGTAGSHPEPTRAPHSTAGKGRPLEGTTSLSRLASLSQSPGADRGQTLIELKMALEFCRNLKFRIALESSMRAGDEKASETQLRNAKAFCDASPATMDSVVADLMGLGPADDVVQAFSLRSLGDEEIETLGLPMAERIVTEARSPAALNEAAMYLFRNGRQLPQAERIPVPASLVDDESVINAQRLAIQMYACSVRGGCGPGGLYSMYYCGRVCGDTQSLTDSWATAYSPDTIRYARALAARLGQDP